MRKPRDREAEKEALRRAGKILREEIMSKKEPHPNSEQAAACNIMARSFDQIKTTLELWTKNDIQLINNSEHLQRYELEITRSIAQLQDKFDAALFWINRVLVARQQTTEKETPES